MNIKKLMGAESGMRTTGEMIKSDAWGMGDLFRSWKLAHEAETDTDYISGTVPKGAFLPDGIIDSEKYNKSKKKVLFVAKEAYWFAANDTAEQSEKYAQNVMFWHKKVAFGEVKKTMFSKRLSILANAMVSGDYLTVNKDHKALQSVAVMNLNKRGGFSYCVWNTLEQYVVKYHSYIEQEIRIIAPDRIVCCGDGVRWLLNKYVDISPEVQIITVSHPSYFALSDSEYLHQLECAMMGKQWCPKRNSNAAVKKMKKKGIIFDTNKTYSVDATFDMLTSGKISAVGAAARFLNSFDVEDYAFYYVKGRGVVAAGEIISELSQTRETGESYKMVRMIVPEKLPVEEVQLREIPASRLKEIMGHGFYFASTTKRPYLTEEESLKLIAELKRLYSE